MQDLEGVLPDLYCKLVSLEITGLRPSQLMLIFKKNSTFYTEGYYLVSTTIYFDITTRNKENTIPPLHRASCSLQIILFNIVSNIASAFSSAMNMSFHNAAHFFHRNNDGSITAKCYPRCVLHLSSAQFAWMSSSCFVLQEVLKIPCECSISLLLNLLYTVKKDNVDA